VKKTILIAGAALLSVSAFAAAPAKPSTKVLSTEELVTLCKDKANPQSQSYCGGFGQGVYDGYLMTRHPKKAPNTVCIPQGSKNEQVVQEFISWTEANAKYNNKPAADAVLAFLSNRYPCGK